MAYHLLYPAGFQSYGQAVRRTALPANTKLVLYNLRGYVNDLGEGDLPTIQQQMIDTGLSAKSCQTALLRAEKEGFIAAGVYDRKPF